MVDGESRNSQPNEAVIGQIASLAEILANLNFLIDWEAEDAEAVRRYAKQASDAINELGSLLGRTQ